DIDGAEFVQLALKLVEGSGRAPEVLGLHVGSRQVAVRFTEAPPVAEAPFRAVGDGWVLARRAITHEVRAAAEQLPVVATPLVSLGTTEDDETVLLNLRAATSITVAGSRDTAIAFLTAAAAELATGTWITSGRLVLVGLGD